MQDFSSLWMPKARLSAEHCLANIDVHVRSNFPTFLRGSGRRKIPKLIGNLGRSVLKFTQKSHHIFESISDRGSSDSRKISNTPRSITSETMIQDSVSLSFKRKCSRPKEAENRTGIRINWQFTAFRIQRARSGSLSL